jgi:hypothetical protein
VEKRVYDEYSQTIGYGNRDGEKVGDYDES